MEKTHHMTVMPKGFQASLQRKLRKKRFQHFLSLLRNIKPKSGNIIQILDIGGEERFWKMVSFPQDLNVKITLLNLEEIPIENKNLFVSVCGDARNISNFENGSFDICFSNSVIEHVGNFEDQRKMANECSRVGLNYYIQTPNYWFFLEPHFRFPFFHFLPKKARVWLTMNFTLGNGSYKKTNEEKKAWKRVNGVELLSIRQMRELFPEGKIYREKFLGMNKSIIVYKF
ncbi:class I SAM-dependent methyltransferase [Cognataquiflexum rubidum]|uniref:class I SAM-dependent methyltransferase n=1 Tax=Cognataquiflexum rubidum TaxID=2922273 RepID=UPI001F12F04B|nr:class I SAM-dependent methyltransferase [Cognataquiflexum rubidum]MCH6236477.1 class I SAM-dependent methyltransferase [Cognataquiflexum rubidum]